MNLNGWQRLWVVATALIWLICAVIIFDGKDRADAFWTAIILPAVLYAIGLALAWVRSGFKRG